jgi:DNA-binding response OmpR family regulator
MMKSVKSRLLLVEDDVVTQTALTGILRLRGYEVAVATTLAEARAILDTQEGMSAVILDLMLPDGEGESLMAVVRRKLGEVPVIVTTGANDSARLARVEAMGTTLLLRKPIVLSDLLSALPAKG